MNFKLNETLKNDCFILAESASSFFLLLNNSLVPWFILVPKTDKVELHELQESFRNEIYQQIDELSKCITKEFEPDKLNIAAIGNVVQQMHIHIIARYKTDFCWPNTVWGRPEKKMYSDEHVQKIQKQIVSTVSFL